MIQGVKKGGARPLLKWAGGKTQLLPQLKELFPVSFEAYFEPFFGGGAVFFAVAPVTGQINDINESLIHTYVDVRDNTHGLIEKLQKLESQYLSLSPEMQSEFYYEIRLKYNQSKVGLEKSSYLIFLNKTCFNGLYRENRKGEFNVPFGRHKNPKICDEENLRAAAKSLRYVKISSGSFERAVANAKSGDFVYLDPPYYPLNPTSSFTSYSADSFDANDQRKLKILFDELTKRGCKVALSNSDSEFIRDLYKEYRQEKVWAGRSINAKGNGRGKITELVVLNY